MTVKIKPPLLFAVRIAYNQFRNIIFRNTSAMLRHPVERTRQTAGTAEREAFLYLQAQTTLGLNQPPK